MLFLFTFLPPPFTVVQKAQFQKIQKFHQMEIMRKQNGWEKNFVKSTNLEVLMLQ